MNNENKRTAEDVAKQMNTDNSVATEKNLKLAFIFSIIALIAAIVGVTYSAILLIYVAYVCSTALKEEEYKGRAVKPLVIAGIALLVTIIRVVVRIIG